MKNNLKYLLDTYNVDKIKSMTEDEIDNFVLEIVMTYKKSELFLYYIYLLDNMYINASSLDENDNERKIQYLLKNKLLKNLRSVVLYISSEERDADYVFLHKNSNIDDLLKILDSEEYKEFCLEKLV